MACRDRQTPLELLQSAIDWEELRAAYWQDSQPDYAKECRSRAQGHRNRVTVELRAREAAYLSGSDQFSNQKLDQAREDLQWSER